MNIAIFTDTYYPETNGVAISTKILVDALKSAGNQVLVVTSVISNKQPSKEGNVIYIPFPVKGTRGYFGTRGLYSLTMLRHVKAFKPDVIHVQTNGQIAQLGLYTSKLYDIPFVYTYHTFREKYATYVDGSLSSRIIRASERRYFQKMTIKSTEFIAPSLKIKNYLRKKGVDKYINVIPTGVNPEWFSLDEATKKDIKYLRKKYELEDSTKVLLYIGGLVKEKSVDYLIKAFKKYIDAYQEDVRLLIIGDGEQTEELEKLVNSLELDNYVTLTGKVNHEKIKSFYLMADAYVNASLSETQSLSIIEAMSSLTPVIARDDNLLSDMIEDEVNGFIYGDGEQFVTKLYRCLHMEPAELEKLKATALKTVTNQYNVENYADKVLEVYNRAQRKNW